MLKRKTINGRRLSSRKPNQLELKRINVFDLVNAIEEFAGNELDTDVKVNSVAFKDKFVKTSPQIIGYILRVISENFDFSSLEIRLNCYNDYMNIIVVCEEKISDETKKSLCDSLECVGIESYMDEHSISISIPTDRDMSVSLYARTWRDIYSELEEYFYN